MLKKGNKRGFLLAEETLKIVLAVICIVILAYVLFALYFGYSSDQDLKQAKVTLDRLIISLNDKETSYYVTGLKSFKKWLIFGWPYEGIMPKSCELLGTENCICICKNGGDTIWGSSASPAGYVEDCNEMGYCLGYDKDILIGTEKAERGIIVINDDMLKLQMNYSEEGVNIYTE